MIANKLTEYTAALNNLPEEIKNNTVDMMSVVAPKCGTPGCHAGLVSIVADYLPELQECYERVLKYEGISNTPCYVYHLWADALAMYLGFEYCGKYGPSRALTRWVTDNADIWDNLNGYEMFFSGRAFGQETSEFPHSVIIDHFTKMSDRLNKKEANK